jgi:hypothetical protein
MKYHDGRDELGIDEVTKRSRNERFYYNSRLELAEGECIELQECIEQRKILLEEKEANLQEKKRKVKYLRNDVRKFKYRVLELEADKYFLVADNQERSVREKTLLEKLGTLEQESSERTKKMKDQKWKAEYRLKHQVLKAFEWEEKTANTLLLRVVCAFWDDSNRKQRISQRDRFLIWKELTLDGWGGKMRIELEKEFVKSKNSAQYGWRWHLTLKVGLT